MLEFLRKTSTSFFAWLILGVLALVFGLSFGLPSENLTFGSRSLVEVHGDDIGEEEYRFQYNLLRMMVGMPSDERVIQMYGLRGLVLETAIERDLLAHEAEQMGLAATERDAEDIVLQGHAIVLGQTIDWLGDIDAFNYNLFQNLLRNLQISEQRYLEEQRKAFLARTLRDVIRASTTVSESEIREAYERTANTLTIRYARYEPRAFADLVDPTPEEISAWVADHKAELEAAYASQGSRFTKLPKQVRLRVIEIPKAAAGEPGSDAAAVAKRAKDRIAAGEDFRKVARELSKHQTAPQGGDYGWMGESSGTGLDPKVDEAVAALQPGQVSDVIEGDAGFYVVQLVGRREGDIAQADALPELAEEAVKAARGKELAKQKATEDLAAIKAGKSVEEVFETPDPLPEGGGIEDAGLPGEDKAAGKVALQEAGPFSKSAPIPDLGAQPELVEALWTADPKTPLLDRTFDVGDAIVLAGLVEKSEASDEAYAEARAEIYDRLAEFKGNEVVARWSKRRCIEAKASGDLVASEDRIARVVTYDQPEQSTEGEEAETPKAPPYTVCDRVGTEGDVLNPAMRMRAPGG